MAIQPGTAGGIEVGAVIGDTYEVSRLIGRGGMGSVWAADHRRLPGKQVAIKVLHTDVAADAESLARFRREAEVASRLGHANIVQVIDFNTLPDGAPYLVLELLQGESLDQRLTRGAMGLDETLALVRQIASGLSAAHREQVIHRDLKPQNIFLVPTEMGGDVGVQAKILDFGISKIRGSQTIKTQESTLLGTPQYMAPEQATGAHSNVDQTTDVFALGAIVYEMLSSKPAFGGQSVPEVVFKVVYEQPPALAGLVPGLPGDVVAAIERALAKKQPERFPDVNAFIEALTGRPLITLRAKTPAPIVADPTRQVSTADTQAADSGAFDKTLHSGNHPQPQLPMPSAADVVSGNTGKRAQPAEPRADDAALAKTIATTGSGRSAAPAPSPAEPQAAAPATARRGTLALIAAAVVALAIGAVLLTRGGDEPAAAESAGAEPAAVQPAAVQPAAVDEPEATEPAAADEPEATEPAAADEPEATEPAAADEPEATDEPTADAPKRKPRPAEAKDDADTADDADDAPLPPRLRQANDALAAGRADEAIRLAKQALRGATPRAKQRIYGLIAVAYCHKQDLNNARAFHRKTRGPARKRASRQCANVGVDL